MKYARSTDDKENKVGWQTLPDHLAGVTELWSFLNEVI